MTKATNKRIEIELPFAGFYESIHDQNIDSAIECMLMDDQGDISEEVSDAIYNADVDWKSIQKEYCQQYVDNLASEIDLDLQYSDMTSPREYNFSTDRLFVTILEKQLNKVRKEVEAYPEYAQAIKDRFTSYDGFMSFYSNDCNDMEWTRKELDQCQYEVIFDLYFEHNLNDDYQIWLVESFHESDAIGQAIDKILNYQKQGV